MGSVLSRNNCCYKKDVSEVSVIPRFVILQTAQDLRGIWRKILTTRASREWEEEERRHALPAPTNFSSMGNPGASTSVVQTLPPIAGRKRKRADTLVVYCSTDEHSETDRTPATSIVKPRKYACTYDGCTKSYTKPSRLDEHVRSHTGEVSVRPRASASRLRGGQRPYQCAKCSKSYLRESHLNAHARTHLDASEKKFICQANNCSKAFWTAQHLKVHTQVHEGVKPFAVRVFRAAS